MWKIFNQGKPTTGSFKSKERAEHAVNMAVKRSKKCVDFEPQKKSDYKIIKTKK